MADDGERPRQGTGLQVEGEQLRDLRLASRQVLEGTPAAHPDELRTGKLLVSTTRATGPELETIKRALLHPPAKADLTTTLLTFASSLLVAFKLLTSAHDKDGTFHLDGFTLLVVSVALVAAFASVSKYLAALRKKDPLNEQALAYVNDLITEQEAEKARNRAEH
jgi:hypothetical protein